nr:putative inactive receptor kinase [Quercus suber]
MQWRWKQEQQQQQEVVWWCNCGYCNWICIGFSITSSNFDILCRKKSSSKKGSTVDIVTVKHPEVEIPGKKSVRAVENGGYGNGYSVVAAVAMAMTRTAKAEVNGGGAGVKKLVFIGNAAKVFDLEDLLRASTEVLGWKTFGTAYKVVLEMGTIVAMKRLKDVAITEKEFRDKIKAVGIMDH